MKQLALALKSSLASTSAFLRARRALGGPIAALGLRGSGALLNIAVFTLAARCMAPEEFGRLAMSFSALSILAVAATLGQDTFIARAWSEHCRRDDQPTAIAAYAKGWETALLGAGAGALLVAFVGGPAFGLSVETARAGAAFLFMQTILAYSSSSSRVIAGFLISERHREATWRVLLIAAVAAASACGGGLTAASFFWFAALGMSVACLLQIATTRRFLPQTEAARRNPRKLREWRGQAAAMWLSAAIEAISQHADVMLIGFLASPVVAGDFFVAGRIAGVFLMLVSGLGAYAATHGPNLYFSGRRLELQNMLRGIATVTLALAAPALAAILLLGRAILSIFGERFVEIYPTLAVLSCATFTVAICGVAPGVLLLTGLEKSYSRIAVAAAAGRIVLSGALATVLGSIGAALGWAFVAAPVAIVLVLFCRKMRGVDPSAFSLLSRPMAAESEH